jgi:hypothetical protein
MISPIDMLKESGIKIRPGKEAELYQLLLELGPIVRAKDYESAYQILREKLSALIYP